MLAKVPSIDRRESMIEPSAINIVNHLLTDKVAERRLADILSRTVVTNGGGGANEDRRVTYDPMATQKQTMFANAAVVDFQVSLRCESVSF